MSATRVAIVGFGPRGAGALERLIAHAAPDAGPLEVTIFEPHRDLGAGPAYAHDQPEFLLMNFPASKIDVSWQPGGLSFVDWSESDPDLAGHWYPPRATVGRYLSDVADELLRTAPFPVELLAEKATGLDRHEGSWQLRSASGSREFDQVLLTVGHARSMSSTATADQVEPGSRVAIRGFGLTGIDRILELTEGRGGRFEQTESNPLTYQCSGLEPAVILPHTRSGRVMLVKPELDRALVPRNFLLDAIGWGRSNLIGAETDAFERLKAEIASLCRDLLHSHRSDEAARAWVADAAGNRLGPPTRPAAALLDSLRVDRGELRPNLNWALGLAWRELYPAVIERFSHGGLDPGDRPAFGRLASGFERLAFGPPPINAAKLLALVRAGRLDLSRLADPSPGAADFELDAVSEVPGLREQQQPLTGLRARGLVRVPPGARGIEVDRSARCVGADGRITEGLAACGRVTEDWVVGNDTLNRQLHPEIDRWAASVCAASPVRSTLSAAL